MNTIPIFDDDLEARLKEVEELDVSVEARERRLREREEANDPLPVYGGE